MEKVTFARYRPILGEVLGYWEPRRIFYNVLLLWATFSDLKNDGALEMLRDPRVLLTLCGMAFAANVLYCAAHVTDFALRYTRFREGWLKMRWALLVAGCWLAVFLAHQQTGLVTGLFRMI